MGGNKMGEKKKIMDIEVEVEDEEDDEESDSDEDLDDTKEVEEVTSV
jgi:hypothetical protein